MAYDKQHPDDTLSEEASALGKRVKGAAKDGIGVITGNERLEREGERENAEGRARQANNDVFDETDGVRGETVRNSGATWTPSPTSSTFGGSDDRGLRCVRKHRHSANGRRAP